MVDEFNKWNETHEYSHLSRWILPSHAVRCTCSTVYMSGLGYVLAGYVRQSYLQNLLENNAYSLEYISKKQ